MYYLLLCIYIIYILLFIMWFLFFFIYYSFIIYWTLLSDVIDRLGINLLIKVDITL